MAPRRCVGLVLWLCAWVAGCVSREVRFPADAGADRVDVASADRRDGVAEDRGVVLVEDVSCPEGTTRCRGVCVDLQRNASHCGACESACAVANGTAGCAAGACVVTSCAEGFADCDGNAANGCEVTPTSDIAHCGGCGWACARANANVACIGGECQFVGCQAPYGNCDDDATNGCEVDLSHEVNHCGACRQRCALWSATAECRMGACTVASCAAGFGDCNGDPSDGCETSTLTSSRHCGRCNAVCPAPPGLSASCAASACAVGEMCAVGLGDCDQNVGNGCEVNTTNNVNHCGGCGVACSTNHGVPTCAGGACGITCDAGFADCDRSASNGCEVDTRASVAHCGMCGRACSLPNATAVCAAGACAVASCATGFADCDGRTDNGCEVDLRTSVANCGACSRACTVTNGTAGCAAGACVVANCSTGYGDCDRNAANGCEASLATDAANCGACGRACSLPNTTASCRAGACAVASCAAGFADCDGRADSGCEVATTRDTAHCGLCGTRCATGQACDRGRCVSCGAAGTPPCTAGGCISTTNCSGVCRDLLTDPGNCGSCGSTCSTRANAAPSCDAGVCRLVCAAGFGNCDGNDANGCETNLRSSNTACGGCAIRCQGGQTCQSGSCECVAGMRLCGGACTCLSSDSLNCGRCGSRCGFGLVCINGRCDCSPGTTSCVIACGGASCLQECADLRSDSTNCGSCGGRCSTGQYCVNGACRSCNAPYLLCGGRCGDPRSDNAHCGGCTVACEPGLTTCSDGQCVFLVPDQCLYGVPCGWGGCCGRDEACTACGCESTLK